MAFFVVSKLYIIQCVQTKMSRSFCLFLQLQGWDIFHLTLSLMGFLTNRTLWGGRSFSILFFNRGLVIAVKGQNLKAQPSSLKIVAQKNYWKTINFGKNPKKLKPPYLEIRLFIHKRPAKFKQRHIGCSGFL